MSALQLLASESQQPDFAAVPHSPEVLSGESCLGNFDRQVLLLTDFKIVSLGYPTARVLRETRSERILRGTEPPAYLHTYAGEWVAMHGNQMVSHGADPVQVVAEARERGACVPYLFRVQESDEEVVKIGL